MGDYHGTNTENAGSELFMVNRQFLIKINSEYNLWYDSLEKVYRYRMYCPYCKKVSGCQCYKELETAEVDIADEFNYCCSSKCSLLYGDWDDVGEALSYLGIKRKISELTEEESVKCIEFLLADNDTKKYILQSIDTLSLRKTTKELNHKDRIEILKTFVESDIEDTCDTVGIELKKDIKDLSEEEAKKVLNVLIEDMDDFDMPMGDICK